MSCSEEKRSICVCDAGCTFQLTNVDACMPDVMYGFCTAWCSIVHTGDVVFKHGL